MNMNFHMPVELLSGVDCVKAHAARFAPLGKRALLVTSRHAAKACGALQDVVSALEAQGIAYTLYDAMEQNPRLDTCYAGGQAGRDADFVIGIGGGSALDGAKAVAAFAANPDIPPMALYDALPRKPLPLVAIPTTAGTGSEANPYAVITLPEAGVKKTFKTPDVYPVFALIDPKYTLTLSRDFTVSTALDALCHCIESYLSPKSTVASEVFALRGARLVWEGLARVESGDLGLETRETLLYGSTCGGLAINTTGTGFPHPMGYNLTLSYGLPHGAACAVFAGEYLTRSEQAAPGRVQALYAAMGADGPAVVALMDRLCGYHEPVSEADVQRFVPLIASAGNWSNAFFTVTEAEMAEMYRRIGR